MVPPGVGNDRVVDLARSMVSTSDDLTDAQGALDDGLLHRGEPVVDRLLGHLGVIRVQLGLLVLGHLQPGTEAAAGR